MMTGDICPGTGEVVAHEIEEVQEAGSSGQVDVLETVLADRECGGKEVGWGWQSFADCLKEEKIIVS